MDQTRTTPSQALEQMRHRWMRIVDALPVGTTWGVEAEFTGVTATGRAVTTRGVLSHDGARLRFTDWRGSVLVDEPLRRLAASMAKGDLRCSIDGRDLVFDDFSHLRDRLGVSPPIAADPSGASIDVLAALHDAR